MGAPTAKLLGHTISENEITVHEDNLLALKNGAVPTNVPELRSFLGLCAFANKQVKDYAIIAKPLTDLTRKGADWRWNKVVQDAYTELKQKVHRFSECVFLVREF